MLETIQKNWDDITSKLKMDQELSDISFHTWIEPLKPVAVDGDEVLVLYPGEKFGLDYIQQKKYDFFLHLQNGYPPCLSCNYFTTNSQRVNLCSSPFFVPASGTAGLAVRKTAGRMRRCRTWAR